MAKCGGKEVSPYELWISVINGFVASVKSSAVFEVISDCVEAAKRNRFQRCCNYGKIDNGILSFR